MARNDCESCPYKTLDTALEVSNDMEMSLEDAKHILCPRMNFIYSTYTIVDRCLCTGYHE